MGTANDPAASFDRSAAAYEQLVALNRAGSRRLVAALPDETFAHVVDIGCGTGFATMEVIARGGVREVIGVDPSRPMLDVFAGHLAAHPDVNADLRAVDAVSTGVPGGSADLAICTMALHWMPDRAAAIREMARVVRPGGVVAILAPGEGHDRPTVDLMHAAGPPLSRLGDSIVSNEITLGWLSATLESVGLDAVDTWAEVRERAVPPDSIANRMDAVATHLWDDLPAPQRADAPARMRTAFRSAADPDDLYRYRFVKTFAIARRRA